jgi:truncated hemoglobin YjbI
MTEETLYERLGGHDGIRAVVDDFYRRSRPSASGLDPEGEGRTLC